MKLQLLPLLALPPRAGACEAIQRLHMLETPQFETKARDHVLRQADGR